MSQKARKIEKMFSFSLAASVCLYLCVWFYSFFFLGFVLFQLTRRKNNPPAGKIMRCNPGSTLSGSPSLYHVIVGVGTPSTLQFNVTGS